MRLLEGLAPLAVQQRHQRRFPHIRRPHHGAPLVGGNGAGRLVHHNIAPQPVHLILGADVGNQLQDVIGHRNRVETPLAGDDAFPLRLFVLRPFVHKAERVGFKGHPPAHYFPPFRRREHAVHFHRQAETIQQLRTQVAFLRVHRPHQHKLGGVAHRNALPLHIVAAHGGGVQQHIHQMVVEQVHFVNVQDAPVGAGDEARFKVPGAGFDGLLNVQRAHQPVLGGAHGQVHDTHLPRRRDVAPAGRPAPVANLLGISRRAAVRAARHYRHFGQQRRQRPDGGAFRRPLLAPHQHAADARVDGVEQQRPLHRRLAHNGRKRKAGLAPPGAGSRHNNALPNFRAMPAFRRPRPAPPAGRRECPAPDRPCSPPWQRQCPSRAGNGRMR